MELKMKYSCSYFIYPYIIKEKNYNKYIQGLLKNEKFIPKYFEREKDISIYNFFLPTVRNYVFKNFGFGSKTNAYKNKLDKNLAQNMLQKCPCLVFSYDIGKNAQAKTGEENGIFFKILNIEVICFETGICFIAIKTNIEDTDKFSDLLNFNEKFRDINSEVSRRGLYNNIKIQTSTFSDIKKLSEIIKEIAGDTSDSKKIDIDINRFLVYSYACLDEACWNENNGFSEIENEFLKFGNILNSEFNSSFNNEKFKTVSLGDFIKVGINKNAMTFLTSSINTVNYTTLPFEFENEYFYTYILALYEKFYFAKLLDDFESMRKHSKAAKEFVKFTNELWTHELTNSDKGSLIFEETKRALELGKLYNKTKEQYDVAYKNFKMKDSDILNKIILFLLAASIITNIINFINLYKLK